MKCITLVHRKNAGGHGRAARQAVGCTKGIGVSQDGQRSGMEPPDGRGRPLHPPPHDDVREPTRGKSSGGGDESNGVPSISTIVARSASVAIARGYD